jgi:DNA-binding SARP family transcriptional activator/TolB-like protein
MSRTEATMAKLSLSVLGQPRVEKNGKPVEINRRKAIGLLTYLAVTGEKHTRDRLAGLFWPHEDRKRSRAALRRTLTAIRQAIGSEWLVAEGETVGMRLTGELWLDVKQFDSLLEKYREISAPGDQESAESLALLTEVARLYRTDFLAQFTLDSNTDFSEWQFFQTEDLRRRFSETLARLVAGHARRQEFELAITYARRRLGLDPLEESCHRSLMRLYAASGRASLALRQYKECQRHLQKELGVEPDPATTKLLDDIKARRPFQPEEPDSTKRASVPRPQTDRARKPPHERDRSPGRVVAAAFGVIVIVAAVATAVFLLARPAPRLVTIAVVPLFASDTKGNSSAVLDGMTDALITELARVQRFRVKSTLAVRPFRETALPSSEIARSLGVDYLVSGSILLSDGSIRISLYLISVRDDTTAWAEVYTRDSADVAKTEADVASTAADAIRRHFGFE